MISPALSGLVVVLCFYVTLSVVSRITYLLWIPKVSVYLFQSILLYFFPLQHLLQTLPHWRADKLSSGWFLSEDQDGVIHAHDQDKTGGLKRVRQNASSVSLCCLLALSSTSAVRY